MARRLGNPKWLALKEMEGGGREGLKFVDKKSLEKNDPIEKKSYTETN